MSNGTYFRFYHKCDIYQKTFATNDAGQQYPAYALVDTIEMHFQAPTTQSTGSSDRRLVPYQENLARYEAIIPSENVTHIAYDNRITNIIDRYSNVIESDTFEIVSIQPKFGFSGRKHHVIVSLRRVVEVQ